MYRLLLYKDKVNIGKIDRETLPKIGENICLGHKVKSFKEMHGINKAGMEVIIVNVCNIS
jgi:hypothetical protein